MFLLSAPFREKNTCVELDPGMRGTLLVRSRPEASHLLQEIRTPPGGQRLLHNHLLLSIGRWCSLFSAVG